MVDVFISYARRDLPTAEWIASLLEVAGHRVRYQARDFQIGGDFVGEIHEAIVASRRVIAVLSHEYFASKYCLREWHSVVAQDLIDGRHRLLPVLVENVSELGLLAPLTYVDVPREGKDEAAAQILSALANVSLADSSSKSPASRRRSSEQSRARQLETLQRERWRLDAAGADTSVLTEKIKALRRNWRKGREPQIGEWLADRYQLVRPLGSGAFATVWEAYEARARRSVAVKILHGHLMRDATRVERFRRGARYMAGFDHSRMVRVLDPDVTDGEYYFFVMELVPGGVTLKDEIEGGLCPPMRAIQMICDVGEALAYAHERKILHRDIKPANILVDAVGRAKLTDFDLLRAEDTTGGTEGDFLGTSLFVAPEIFEGSEPDHRADLYSLAKTTLFALTSRPPALHRPIDDHLSLLRGNQALANTLRKALDPSPIERQTGVRAFLAEMKAAIAERDTNTEISIVQRAPRKQRFEDETIDSAIIILGSSREEPFRTLSEKFSAARVHCEYASSIAGAVEATRRWLNQANRTRTSTVDLVGCSRPGAFLFGDEALTTAPDSYSHLQPLADLIAPPENPDEPWGLRLIGLDLASDYPYLNGNGTVLQFALSLLLRIPVWAPRSAIFLQDFATPSGRVSFNKLEVVSAPSPRPSVGDLLRSIFRRSTTVAPGLSPE